MKSDLSLDQDQQCEINYKTNWNAHRKAKNVKFNAQYFFYTGLTLFKGYTEAKTEAKPAFLIKFENFLNF